MIGSMREATQRSVMRCAFIISCVAPTLVVVGWSIAWALPSHTTAVEGRLQQLLGFAVSIGEIQHPRPREVNLRNLQLLDPETDEPLGSINQVFANWSSAQLRLEFDTIEVESNQRQRLWNLSRTHLESHPSFPWTNVVIHARQAQLTADETIHNIAGHLKSNQHKLEARVAFVLHEADDHAPSIEVTVLRDRQTSPLETRMLVNSHDQRLPLSLVSQRWSQRLGPNVQLRGNLLANWLSDEWKIRWVGDLEEIALNSAKITGNGQLEQLDATFTQEGIQELSGTLEVRDGTIDKQVLSQLGIRTESSGDSNQLEIENMKVRFQANDTSIQLIGSCDSATSQASATRPFLISNDGTEFQLERANYWLAPIQGIFTR